MAPLLLPVERSKIARGIVSYLRPIQARRERERFSFSALKPSNLVRSVSSVGGLSGRGRSLVRPTHSLTALKSPLVNCMPPASQPLYIPAQVGKKRQWKSVLPSKSQLARSNLYGLGRNAKIFGRLRISPPVLKPWNTIND